MKYLIRYANDNGKREINENDSEKIILKRKKIENSPPSKVLIFEYVLYLNKFLYYFQGYFS